MNINVRGNIKIEAGKFEARVIISPGRTGDPFDGKNYRMICISTSDPKTGFQQLAERLDKEMETL